MDFQLQFFVFLECHCGSPRSVRCWGLRLLSYYRQAWVSTIRNRWNSKAAQVAELGYHRGRLKTALLVLIITMYLRSFRVLRTENQEPCIDSSLTYVGRLYVQSQLLPVLNSAILNDFLVSEVLCVCYCHLFIGSSSMTHQCNGNISWWGRLCYSVLSMSGQD